MLLDCAVLFNNNIGCIETKLRDFNSSEAQKFNNNIGCIETYVVTKTQTQHKV